MKTNTYFLLLTLLLTCTDVFTQTYTFDFGAGHQNFTGGVSDFHVSQSDQHEFTFDNRNFEPPLDTMQLAQYISGINPSDDLFMYMKREITGLEPHTTYHVTFIVEFASKYPTNAFGVGGPPGEGVTMKAGLTLEEPDTVIIDKGGSFVVMDIDKGNQSMPGVDMDTIGHVGVHDTTTVWAIKTNDNVGKPFTFTTDASGSAWFIIGTDSGFESQTELYFTMLTVDFTISTSVADGLQQDDVLVYPNPSSGQVYVSSGNGDLDVIRIYDTSGRLFRSYMTKSSDVAFYLPRSDYLLKITSGNSTIVKRVIVK
jgi:hypothetical protein